MRRVLNSAPFQLVRGLDQGVTFAALGSVWASLAGLVTLFLVVTTLTPAEQGYYFSFASLLLLQLFMELGFGVVLIQFVSHEAAFLEISERGEPVGPERHRLRLAALVRLALRWYGVVAAGLFVVLGPLGYLFFDAQSSDGVDWVAPWVLVVLTASAGVMIVPFTGLLEGSRQVAVSQRLLLAGNLAGAVGAWVALLAGAGLYAIAVQIGLRTAVSLPFMMRSCRPFLAIRRLRKPGLHFDWRREFMPQQWRISVSWMSGFLMFQAFAPITFQVRGPVAAGQIGSVAQVYQGINLIASSWLIGVQPRFGERGAKRDIAGLVGLVHYTAKRAVASAALLSAAVLALFGVLELTRPELVDRFGGLTTLTIFLATVVLMQLNNVWTSAIRFQKREPFVTISVVSSFLVALATIVLGSAYGTVGVAIGFAAVMVLVLTPSVYLIYRREIRRHAELFAAATPEPADA